MVTTNFIKVWGLPPGLTKDDLNKANNGLKIGVGIQSAPQPSDITAVRSNQPTKRDAEGNITHVASMWLMSGNFESQPWWGNLQATKQAMADALIAVGIPNLPAIINTIEVLVMNQSEMLTMLHDNAAQWGETVA